MPAYTAKTPVAINGVRQAIHTHDLARSAARQNPAINAPMIGTKNITGINCVAMESNAAKGVPKNASQKTDHKFPLSGNKSGFAGLSVGNSTRQSGQSSVRSSGISLKQ
jgi:hypothetical protein